MEVLRQISAIVLVFGLLGTAVWALRRRTGPMRMGAAKSMASVERLSLTPQHAVHLIHMAGRELLIATHPNGLTLLTENKSNHTEANPHDAALCMEERE